MTDVRRFAINIPMSVEMMIDMGYWDMLTSEEQARYLADQARLAAYRRSLRGRWHAFTAWLGSIRPRVHAHRGYCYHEPYE